VDSFFGNGLLQVSSFTQPLFSTPASANLAIELKINALSLKNLPGQTQQLTALVKLEDGTILDITNEAKWLSRDDSIATVFKGEVVSNKIGRTTISASYGGLSTSVVEILNSICYYLKTSVMLICFWAYKEIKQLQEKQIISDTKTIPLPSATVRRDHIQFFSRLSR
jgi:hypothetical protein